MKQAKIELVVNVLKSLFEKEDIELHDFSVILNNMFVHGEIIPDISQEVLDKIYEGIECFFTAAKIQEN